MNIFVYFVFSINGIQSSTLNRRAKQDKNKRYAKYATAIIKKTVIRLMRIFWDRFSPCVTKKRASKLS